MALQIRRGTDADWEITKQNIKAGEPAVALDTGRFFVGTDDGEFAEFANVENYYDKNDVDDIEDALQDSINTKADASDTYTKAQVDTALNGKVDKVTGKGLSQNDFTNALKTKLDGVEAGAEVNVQSDWNEADSTKDDFIKNKPSVYTKSEVDSALALKANAADVYEKEDVYTKDEIDAELEDYAKVDGNYDSLTSGTAKQLLSNMFLTDDAPYQFRTAGGALEIADRETDTLVGGSVAWNQLADTSTTQTVGGVTYTAESDGYRIDGTANSVSYIILFQSTKFISGHRYLLFNDSDSTDYGFYPNVDFTYSNKPAYFVTQGNLTLCVKIGVTVSNVKLHPQLFDLTQMFGATIADYIYSLETATAGDGVAWFKRYFPNDYYAYNAGSIESVSASAHKMTGFKDRKSVV